MTSLAEHGGATGPRDEGLIDGNKRTAFPSVGLFLGLNGHRLDASQTDAFLTVVAAAAGEIDEPHR